MTEEKKKKRITVSSAKAKGRSFQYMVCEMISNLLSIPWGQEDDKLIQSRLGGQKGTDIILRGVALEKFPYSVECKNQEKVALFDYIKQANANQKERTNWLLFIKKNKLKHPIVVLDSIVFFDILKQLLIAQETALRGHTDKENNKPV